LIGLKQNAPALTLTNLKKMVILFAMFGNSIYVSTILQHLLLFEYQRSIDHPAVDLFLKNLFSLVGEDIELGNRALSHVSIRSSRRSDLDLLDKAYRLVRFLRNAGVQFGEDMFEYREITKGSRRYDVDDETTLGIIRKFMTNLLNSFEDGSFTHYKIPFKYQQTSKRVRLEPGTGPHEILVLISGHTEKKVAADAGRTLMEVPYLGAFEWIHYVDQSFKKLLAKPEDQFQKLDRKTLEFLVNNCPKYASKQLKDYLRDNPVVPIRERKTPRLFSQLKHRKIGERKESVDES
jgi:hypothetical protein